MYLYACAVLWAMALALNTRDQRTLLLALFVGASIFTPVPHDTAVHFYTFCISAECLVALLAYWSRTRAGDLVFNVCLLLLITHVLGYSLNGSQALSPYRSIVKILEVSQLLACIACSPFLSRILRNREATPE